MDISSTNHRATSSLHASSTHRHLSAASHILLWGRRPPLWEKAPSPSALPTSHSYGRGAGGGEEPWDYGIEHIRFVCPSQVLPILPPEVEAMLAVPPHRWPPPRQRTHADVAGKPWKLRGRTRDGGRLALSKPKVEPVDHWGCSPVPSRRSRRSRVRGSGLPVE